MFSQDGQLVGLVTSNTRHAGSGRNFAKLNYSIASSALLPIVDAITRQQAADIDWAALDLQDPAMNGIWELRDDMLRPGQHQSGVQRFKQILEESDNKDLLKTSGAPESKL